MSQEFEERILTKEEMEIIAGGYQSITPIYPYEPYEPYDPWYDPYDQPWSDGGSGGSGGEPSNEDPLSCTCPKTSAEVDHQTDQGAASIARAIAANPENASREFIGFIYKDESGQLHTTMIHTGVELHVNPYVAMQNEGITASQIVGIVHNHPPQALRDEHRDLSPEIVDKVLLLNRLPSDGDMDQASAIFQGRENCSIYVVGPDGVLREYEPNDFGLWRRRNEIEWLDTHSLITGNEVSESEPLPDCPVH